eukprot:1019634-Prorocentrum_minimum.AAC.1
MPGSHRVVNSGAGSSRGRGRGRPGGYGYGGGGGRGGVSRGQVSDRPCHSFNSSNGCTWGPGCRFAHVCNKCGQSGHGRASNACK